MSVYFSVYTCESCNYQVPLGFIGKEQNRTIAICKACTYHFHVYPDEGEKVVSSNKPHKIYVRGKKWVEVSSKKGRIKKNIYQDAWLDIGTRIPVNENVVLRGENLHILYSLAFDDVNCPNCQVKGSLVDYVDYLEHCPICKGKMSESEL